MIYTPQTQDINWTYIRCSEGVQDLFWTPYKSSFCSIYVLCLQGYVYIEAAELWCIVSSKGILRLLQKKNSTLIGSFYCCLKRRGWAQKVAKQFAIRGLVTYTPILLTKKIKCKQLLRSVRKENVVLTVNWVPRDLMI